MFVIPTVAFFASIASKWKRTFRQDIQLIKLTWKQETYTINLFLAMKSFSTTIRMPNDWTPFNAELWELLSTSEYSNSFLYSSRVKNIRALLSNKIFLASKRLAETSSRAKCTCSLFVGSTLSTKCSISARLVLLSDSDTLISSWSFFRLKRHICSNDLTSLIMSAWCSYARFIVGPHD